MRSGSSIGLAAATVGQEDIRFIPTGDATRMDALWIVHGLPVSLLERLDEFRAQYENSLDFPNRDEFHLNPQWASLPDITLSALDTPAPPTSSATVDSLLAARPDAVRRRSLT